MLTLPEIREKAMDTLEDHLSVLAAGHPMSAVGTVLEAAIEVMQAIGSTYLLLDYDLERFRRYLVFSGYGRRYLLRRCHAEGETNLDCMAISRTQAFLNTYLARHEALAAEIVAASPDRWLEGAEYEDDYCYVAFLHRFALNPDGADAGDLESLLDRFAASMQDQPSARHGVCRALLEGDAEAFRLAFDGLVVEHEAWIDAHKARQGYEPVPAMRCRVFVEGLALLKIAERSGIAPETEFRWCPRIPDLAGRGMPPWPDDPFEELERTAVEFRSGRAAPS